MFAIVRTGGKQYRVAADQKIIVDKIDGEVGDKIALDDVLMLGEGDSMKDASKEVVHAEIVEQAKAKKIKVYKKKRRQGYERTRGHRQQLTVLKITGLGGDAPAAKTTAAKKDAPAEKPAEGSETAAAKTEAKAEAKTAAKDAPAKATPAKNKAAKDAPAKDMPAKKTAAKKAADDKSADKKAGDAAPAAKKKAPAKKAATSKSAASDADKK